MFDTSLLPAPAPPPATAAAGSHQAGASTWVRQVEAAAAQLSALLAAYPTQVEALGRESKSLVTLADQVVRQMTAVKLAATRAYEKNENWDRSPYRTVEKWRAASSSVGSVNATREANQARDLELLPEAERDLAAGLITPEHVGAMSHFVRRGDTDKRRAALEGPIGNRLLEAARRQDAQTFAKTAKRLGHLADAQGAERDFQQIRSSRFLRMAPRNGGIGGEFFLDAVAGEELKTALQAYMSQPLEGDERTYRQRQADALADIARKALDNGNRKTGAAMRPHVIVTIDAATLAAAQLEAARRNEEPEVPRHSPTGARVGQESRPSQREDESPRELPGLAGHAADPPDEAICPADPPDDAIRPAGPPDEAIRPATTLTSPPDDVIAPAGPPDAKASDRRAQLDALAQSLSPMRPATFLDGTPIPPSALARLLCDCLVGRVAVDADGRPTDVGRAERSAPESVRRAVIDRDRKCRFPGCDKPAEWSEFHHIDPWEHGGITSTDNGILLCSDHHHRSIHGQGVRIRAVPGGFRFTSRTGVHIGTTFHETGQAAL